MSYPYVKISKVRGTKGVVTAPDGSVLGRVMKCRKDAAGTYPNPVRHPFYTATVEWQGQTLGYPSLGTRHPTRAHAARAIRLFWEQNYWTLYSPSQPHAVVVLCVAKFKRHNREACALREVV